VRYLNVVMWNVAILTAAKSDTLCRVVEHQSSQRRLQVLGLCEVGRVLPEFVGFTRFQGLGDASRSDRGAGRGQGLCVFVHDDILRFTKLVKATQYTIWLSVREPQRPPLMLCFLYLPPATSTVSWSRDFCWEDALCSVQQDIKAFSAVGEVCILGDFNAHTAVLDDRGTVCEGVSDDMGLMMGGAGTRPLVSIPPPL
jgi:hypothetical protein